MSNNYYSPNKLNIAVIGGGNIGTQFACVCASKGYKVNVFSSKPEKYNGTLEIVNEFEEVTVGKLNKVSSDIAEVLNGCRVIFVTYPANMLKETANLILPYVSCETEICVLPGTGGAEFSFSSCINKGATLYGLQRVPSVARIEEYGKRVRCEGIRDKLYIASVPNGKADSFGEFISSLWNIPCVTLPNYLSVTLTPSNPILHTSRLCTLFEDYSSGKVYKRNPLFYGEWTDKSSKLLLACDEELQNICRKLTQLDLSNVLSLKLHYNSETVKEMTDKLSSIKSLHNLSSPMKKVDGGWVPDFNSRYFTADFPYGLEIIENLAKIIGVSVPNINKTMSWYRKLISNIDNFNLNNFGIYSEEDIYRLYGKN